MTTVTLSSQARLRTPVAVPHFFMRATEGDVGSGALRAISDTWPVPAHVLAGGGTIGSRYAELSDDQIEACVRDWCYRNTNWTGAAAAGVPTNGRAIDLYDWMVANAAANGGKGPTLDCGNISKIYLGFLAGYGINARSVYGRTASSVDNTAEYWSPDKAGWVHVLPHVNGHIEFDATGVRASLHDWTQVERLTGNRTGKVHAVHLGGSDGTNLKSGVTAGGWAGYSKWNLWKRGNRVQFPNGDSNALSWTPFQAAVLNHAANMNNSVYLYAPVGGYAGDAASMAAAVKARHLDDIEFKIGALRADAQAEDTGMVMVQLEHNLLDFAKYQVKAPGSTTWTDLESSGAFAFLPIAGETWRFRAVGPLGNRTNVVTATVS